MTVVFSDYSLTKNTILESTNIVFTSTSYEHRTYSYEELKGFSNEALTKEPDTYLRRLNGMPEIFRAATYYQRNMTEHLAVQYLGKGGTTPLNLLETKLLNNDPRALKIAAIVYQLGRDVNMTPSIPAEMMSQIEGAVRVVPVEAGQITVESLNEVSIHKDLIVIESLEGTKLATYRVDHFITVEEPDFEGSVECQITRTFKPVLPYEE